MEGQAGPSRKRRAPAMVTLIACTECRRKRSKCDGKKPCGRCAARDGLTCVYDVHLRTTKETMKNEIDKLRAHRKVTDRIMNALTFDEHSGNIIRQLKDNVALESIADGLETISSVREEKGEGEEAEAEYKIERRGGGEGGEEEDDDEDEEEDEEEQEKAGGPIRGKGKLSVKSPSGTPYDETYSPLQGDKATHSSGASHRRSKDDYNTNTEDESGESTRSPLAERESGLPYVFGKPKSISGEGTAIENRASAQSWTNVTSDTQLIEHLLTLYFCWEYPTFASLSKEHFFMDFRSGRQRFSDLPQAQGSPGNSGTAGDQYFEECERLLAGEEGLSLPTVQALGLMALREASCGRDSVSLHYSRRSMDMAIELKLHEDCVHLFGKGLSPMEREVRSATFWGCFNLELAWSLCIGKNPQLRHYSRQRKKPAIVGEIEEEEWIPYTDDGMPLERDSGQPSHIRSVYKAFCELSEVVHDTLHVVYKREGRLTSQEILAAYRRYLNWYSSLPDALRLGQNFTPSVLFTHMYYHFGILLLFRPFLKLVLLRSAVSPREICTQAAENISSLLRSYRNLYTLRCTPSFVPYIVLASGIIHLVNANTVLGSAYCDKAVKDLTDLSVCHSFAKRSVKILLSLAHRWRVSIAHGPWDSEDPKANPIRDLDTLPSSMDFFTLDPEEALPTFEETSVRSSRTRPLFSLFAKQGLPPIFFSDDLRLSGRDDTNTGRSTESQLALGGFDIATSSNAISFNQGGFPTQERDEDDDDNMWMD